MIRVGLVIDLTADEIKGFQLVGVPNCEDDFVGVEFAVALDFGRQPSTREVDFVKDNDIVG